jgi:hypothetical protein
MATVALCGPRTTRHSRDEALLTPSSGTAPLAGTQAACPNRTTGVFATTRWSVRRNQRGAECSQVLEPYGRTNKGKARGAGAPDLRPARNHGPPYVAFIRVTSRREELGQAFQHLGKCLLRQEANVVHQPLSIYRAELIERDAPSLPLDHARHTPGIGPPSTRHRRDDHRT